MLQTNPFSILAESISPLAMQGFIIAMIVLIVLGTIIQMIHHKNLTYFFNNARKAKPEIAKNLTLTPASHATVIPPAAINKDVPRSGCVATKIIGEIRTTTGINKYLI